MLTAVSCGASVADFISMTEPSKLVQKAIGRPNATWNSVKNELFPSLGDRSDSYMYMYNYVTVASIT